MMDIIISFKHLRTRKGRFSLCSPLPLCNLDLRCKTITSLEIRICIRSQLRSPFGNFVKIVTIEDSKYPVCLADYLPAKEVEKFIDNTTFLLLRKTLLFESQIIEHENVWDLNGLNRDLWLFRNKYILLHFDQRTFPSLFRSRSSLRWIFCSYDVKIHRYEWTTKA